MLPNFKSRGPQQANGVSAQSTPPRSTATARSDRAISIVGADATIVGDVISQSELRVDGEIEGDLTGVRLIIGEQARVTGNVAGEDVVLHGQVIGSVRGLRVSLQSTSQVQGDVYHQALVMEQGAFFEGKSVRVADPLAESAPTSEAATAAE